MTKVIVANRLIVGGREYKGGQVVDVPAGEARDLLRRGKVRPLTQTAEAKPAPVTKPVKGSKEAGDGN